MVNKSISFVKEFTRLYSGKHITRAAAALSYYLTMTIFPLIICLYTMLGNSYTNAMRILSFAEKLMAPDTARSIEDFLLYVASNNSNAMMVAGLTVLVTSASAACRSLQDSIGDMQGGQRFPYCAAAPRQARREALNTSPQCCRLCRFPSRTPGNQ